MSARTRPQWSVRSRIAATIVGTSLLGSFIFTSVQASPMTPYENGVTWIADACRAEPNSTRSDAQCISDKCAALYGVGSGAYLDCVQGGYDGLKLVITPVPTPQPMD